MADNRSKFQIRLAAAKRYAMWYHLSRNLNLICITEYPKCGASWLCQILKDYLEIPFPRNVSPKFEKSIMHGHHMPNKKFNKEICFVRDGRDVIVSYYHHLIFGNNKAYKNVEVLTRKEVSFDNYDDIKTNLPRFIEYLFKKRDKGKTKFTYMEFVEKMIEENHFYVSYEEMKSDPHKAVTKVLIELEHLSINNQRLEQIIDKYSFSKQRNQGNDDKKKSHYLRKGIVGDWKNNFTKETCEVFDHYAGDALIMLGYEKDNSWIEKFDLEKR